MPKIFSLLCAALCLLGTSLPLEGRRTRKQDVPKDTSLFFLKGKIPEGDKRFPSFMLALELLKERNARTIVETGTARNGLKNCIGDGCSTCIFSQWAERHGATFHSVDIDPANVKESAKAISSSAKQTFVVCSDSVAFLKGFESRIDFLYLDSYDYDQNDPEPSQAHHLAEIVAAYPRLHEKSVIMIDDCDLPGGGKGKQVIEFLLEKGWKIAFSGYQVIMVKS